MYMALRIDALSQETIIGFSDYHGSKFTAVDIRPEIHHPSAIATSNSIFFTYSNQNGELVYSERAIETSPSISPSGGGGGGCFVASAAFGSFTTKAVIELCNIRDGVIQCSQVGGSMLQLYYSLSPAPSNKLKDNAALRAFLRKIGR